jgi:hypothetical protein
LVLASVAAISWPEGVKVVASISVGAGGAGALEDPPDPDPPPPPDPDPPFDPPPDPPCELEVVVDVPGMVVGVCPSNFATAALIAESDAVT